ncbi:hypothetical protein LMJF_12_0405 [Leishmania major strain Friedlin]|uniref:Proteophosphoglycan ppg4 n=1 Tax=Leishmania major TaxID=5664 RepID=Q4QGQ2_LEIMA|nr:hypothetical protein LMJF_12_0405 [Leishmania major strain Friedlin]CAG9570447.1 hypothetical_protein_-_conserved [Leishmania major strain Friedlin]CAJ02569.1 hypothetical protein LMJF_12_0405 [Leishmania major strain Friedlin]|eukprot:XP_001681646.1 hypothetical protein LMJF_12_0405 [Leishmania major strain Friedlin]
MFAALSWLLDLDQGHAASSSSTSSCSSYSGSLDADAGVETDPAANHTTFSDAGGQLLAELHISSVAAATLSRSASEAAAPPRGAVYSSARHLEESFADLEARKAEFFAPSPCQEPAEDAGLGLSSLTERGGTPVSPLSCKIVPLGSLCAYANETVSLSPIASPVPAPVSATVATLLAPTHEDERLLLVSEGVMLSARLSSPSRGGPRAAAERAKITNNDGSATGAMGAGVAAPTQRSRILDWDREMHARPQASPPPGLSANRGERAVRSGTGVQERSEQIADAEPGEARLVRGAMKAAFMLSTPPHTPALGAAAFAPAAVPLHPSPPFLGTTVGARDAAVPGYSIERIHDTPAQEDSGVVYLADGLATVTSMDVGDLHRQAEQSSPPLTHPLAAQLTTPSHTKQPHFDFS